MANSRVLYYDLLNIAATIAVVYLHCNGIVHTYSDGAEWSTALIVEVLFYWAVPVFFMLTGAKTLGYRAKRDTKSFLSGRFVRIFAPFLFWSAIIFFIRFSGFLFPENPEIPFTVKGFVDALMTNRIEPTYWFFFAMFGVTLSIPVLSLLTSNKKNAVVYGWLFVCVCFFVSVPVRFSRFFMEWGHFDFRCAAVCCLRCSRLAFGRRGILPNEATIKGDIRMWRGVPSASLCVYVPFLCRAWSSRSPSFQLLFFRGCYSECRRFFVVQA